MSKPMLVLVGTVILAFSAGIACGLYFGGSPMDVSGSTKTVHTISSGFFSDAATQQHVEANTQLSERIRDLNEQLAKAQKYGKDIQADRLAFFKKHHDRIYMSSLDGVKVSPAMVEILGLSPQEKNTVEQHLAEVQKQLEDMEDANTTLAKQTTNSVTYAIPPDPRGKALKDQLSQTLDTDIGDDRADMLMTYGEFSSFNSPFHNFAADKNQIDIGWTTKDGKLLYTWKEDTGHGSTWNDTPSPNVPQELNKYLPSTNQP